MIDAALVLAVMLHIGPSPQTGAGQAAPKPAAAPQGDKPTFKQEELDQMLAPIALYPDALLSQVLMASTYPLEIVEADRWAKAHKDQKGDAAAKALEAETWDPSVKSLIDFPPVLEMLSTKLDWTQKLGDAFLGQQKQVMETVQQLRAKAKEAGKLESTENQKVEVKQEGSTEIITIESTSPTVIYVPTYDPVVVYGTWPYPAYPPYPYYPPGYGTGAAFAFGVAWGYAWGHCDWNDCDVDIDIDQNIDFNRDIDRDKYGNRGNLKDGKGKWQHDGAHRGNVPYRNEAVARKNGGVSANDATRARDAYRGRAESGRTALDKGAADSFKSAGATDRAAAAGRDASRPTSTGAARGDGRSGASSSASRASSRASSGRGSALSGAGGGGSAARAQSARGRASRGGGGRR